MTGSPNKKTPEKAYSYKFKATFNSSQVSLFPPFQPPDDFGAHLWAWSSVSTSCTVGPKLDSITNLS